MLQILPISPDNALIFKQVRLRALQDTPTAFGSTYERESQRTDAQWMERAAQNSAAVKSTGYLAIEDGHDDACGIVGGFFDDDGSGPYLVSMWVAPTHRRHGVGERLVDAVLDWARSRGARQISLEVTTINEPAIRFYEKLGFVRTGKVVPYPNDPSLQEYEMVKEIG